ncbi:MAG TPA: HdeD family acid-resistance protein [Thermomicrobiales bacterium]|nr:HdeD family acid-resistance protein [Thermomicrobiales bacterium]
MLRTLSNYWWVFLVRGIVAILFGLAALAWPGLTIATLVIVFGAYALVDGIFAIIDGISTRSENDRWWAEILIGLAGVVAGIWVMAYPGLTAVGLMYFIAAWWLVTGVVQIFYAIRVRKEIANEWYLILTGALSAVLGIAFMLFPGKGALSLIWVIGIYAIVFGILFVLLSFRVKKLGDNLSGGPGRPFGTV